MDFYYQIKGKTNGDAWGSNWSFPPIFSGMVSAGTKKEAKQLIDEEYGKIFPLRVLAADLDSNEFLLSLHEMNPESRYWDLFEIRYCIQCENSYRIIDKYNNANERDKSGQFCSSDCAEQHRRLAKFKNPGWIDINGTGKSVPVIYKITVRGFVLLPKK